MIFAKFTVVAAGETQVRDCLAAMLRGTVLLALSLQGLRESARTVLFANMKTGHTFQHSPCFLSKPLAAEDM